VVGNLKTKNIIILNFQSIKILFKSLSLRSLSIILNFSVQRCYSLKVNTLKL
jgi:hypothetical protein